MLHLRLAGLGIFVAGLLAAGCAGSSTAVPPARTTTPNPTAKPTKSPKPTPTPTTTPSTLPSSSPTPSPTPAKFSKTLTSAATGDRFPFASAGGYGGSILFPSGAISNGTTLTSTTTNVTPKGAPGFTPQILRASAAGSGSPFLYYGLKFSKKLQQNGAVDIEAAFADDTPKYGNYWLALYDPTLSKNWQYGIAGPASLSDGVVNFTLPGGYPFAAKSQYWLAVYTTSSASPTPSPPPAVMEVRPGSLQLKGTGTANAGTLSIIEPGYRGYFQLSTSNAKVATVAQGVVLGPTGTASIVPAGGGKATITVSDSNGQIQKIFVGVTAGIVVVHGVHQ